MIFEQLPFFVNVSTKTPGSIHSLYTITRGGIPILGWIILATVFAAIGVAIIASSVFTGPLSSITFDLSLYFFALSFAFYLYALLPTLLLVLAYYGGIAAMLAIIGYAASQLLS